MSHKPSSSFKSSSANFVRVSSVIHSVAENCEVFLVTVQDLEFLLIWEFDPASVA
ncbi:31483_t:CDS:2, partial [Gigaspora margarita]